MNCILKKHALAWALGGTLMGSFAGCAADTTVALEDELAAAREAEGLDDVMPVELSGIDDELETEVVEGGTLIQELELEGRVIRFVEEEDGSVGVLEVAHARQPLLSRFTREEGVTSLELFQALAPELEVPETITTAHANEAEALERADLAVVPFITALGFDNEPGVQSYFDCDATWGASNPYDHYWKFNNSWHLTYKNLTEVEESMVLEDFDITHWKYFYAGGDVVRRVYLGVCVGDKWANSVNSGSDEVDFEVQRLTNGSWSTITSYHLWEDDLAIYYNASWRNYRYRGRIQAHDPAGGTYTWGRRHIGMAVAYDKPLQLQFGLAP